MNSRFLAYSVISARVEMEANGLGTTFLELSSTSLGEMRLPSPELSTQKSIADYLDRETTQIDAFIAKNEELIALLTERRQVTIEDALSPSAFNGAYQTCQIRRLGPRAESGVSVNGFQEPASEGAIGVLKTGAVSKGYFDPSENKQVVPEDLERVATPVLANRLIVNRANTPDLVGRAGWTESSHPNLYLSDKLWQLSFKDADPKYLHYWTHSSSYREQLRSLSVGASSSMQNLSYNDFLSLRVTLPASKEQGRIAAELDLAMKQADSAIDTAHRAIELAKERRAALISAAVTGKIDVSKEASAV